MADSAQDKNLPASQRRIERARKEGQVARSRDLSHLAVLGSGIAVLAAFAPQIVAWMAHLLTQALRFDAQAVAQPSGMSERVAELLPLTLLALLPIGIVTAAVAMLSAVLAGGWNFTWQPLAPTLDKVNPLAGIKRMFAGHQLAEMAKACLLALVLGGVGAWVLSRHWQQHAQLLAMPLPAALAAGGELLRTGLLVLGGVLAVFALIDVPLQRQLLLRRLRMSVQEAKEELKEVEGRAEVKQRLRQRMREIAKRRMLAAVPTADLVVMNPSHFAVALKYDDSKMAAPRVVAKGADLLAFTIRDRAKEHGVPVLQSPPLARALYAHCEVDAEVPARLFAAVAQVLAWVYQLRDAARAGRALAAEAPNPEVPADMDPANKAAAEGPAR
jgi:flagellar biosynthetic protein FlhB